MHSILGLVVYYCLKVVIYFATGNGEAPGQFEKDPIGLTRNDHTIQDLRTLFFQQTYITSLYSDP